MMVQFKIKFIQPTELRKIGDEVYCSKKDAEGYVSRNYAQYVEEPKKEGKTSKKQNKKIKNSPVTSVKLPSVKLNLVTSAKEILKEAQVEQKFDDLIPNQINWLEGSFWDSWNKVKGYWNNIIRPDNKVEFSSDERPKVDKWFFLSHDNDEIVGKPQLMEGVMKRILLVRMAMKNSKAKDEMTGEKYKTPRYIFFDERYDKRYDGPSIDSFALDFWFYRLQTNTGKEYFMLSQKKLPTQNCTFKGMKVEMDDVTEITKNLKVKSLSRFFFVKSFEPDVKILSKDQIVSFTKSREIDLESWRKFLAYHPLGTFNRYPEEVENLRSAHVLSGKVDGYPLQLVIMGTAGTTKTMGHIETLDHKFNEQPYIADGGNVRLKGLVPSYKQTIPDIGHLARAERMAFVDEIGKMIEFELNKHQGNQQNILGEFNDLLEHKDRIVGSGNTGMINIQATAKFLFVTNPVSNKDTVYKHVGPIDATTMSRMLWWVQDPEEVKFVLSGKGIIRIPPEHRQAYIPKKIRKHNEGVSMSWGDSCNINREEFLTLFDTCYSFLSEMNDELINALVAESVMNAHEPMKSVWKPRAYHHVKLLVDGLCKQRCLFEDYDPSFKAKYEDYENAKKIITRMVKGWGTDLSVKKEIFFP